jgi:hypothetical protein
MPRQVSVITAPPPGRRARSASVMRRLSGRVGAMLRDPVIAHGSEIRSGPLRDDGRDDRNTCDERQGDSHPDHVAASRVLGAFWNSEPPLMEWPSCVASAWRDRSSMRKPDRGRRENNNSTERVVQAVFRSSLRFDSQRTAVGDVCDTATLCQVLSVIRSYCVSVARSGCHAGGLSIARVSDSASSITRETMRRTSNGFWIMRHPVIGSGGSRCSTRAQPKCRVVVMTAFDDVALQRRAHEGNAGCDRRKSSARRGNSRLRRTHASACGKADS